MKNGIMLILLTTVLALATPANACKSAGPNKHVGVITSIDLIEHTMVLQDAETGEAMTFFVSDQVIKPVRPNQNAVVTFEKTAKGMVAIQIKI